MKSNFDIVLESSKIILIRDNCNEMGTMSVTNDAENVVLYLYKNYNLGNRKLYYVDTNKYIDELDHKDDKFIGFKRGFKNIVDFKRLYHTIDSIIFGYQFEIKVL